MKENNLEKNLYKQNRDLKQRCKELSQENLLLKSEIADMRITNILLGGVQVWNHHKLFLIVTKAQ